MNIKSLLLGSAAALVAVSGARAADAIEVVAEPEPVEYVRVCETYGAGFYYIPGTETCLRVGGFVRYQVAVGNDFELNRKVTHNVIRGRRNPRLTSHTDVVGGRGAGDYGWAKSTIASIQLDARTETEYGTLRAFIDARTSNGSTGGSVDKAFLSLGGLTIGRASNAFDYDLSGEQDELGNGTMNVIKYTFDGGNGFVAEVSIDDDGDTYLRSAGFDDTADFTPNVSANVQYSSGIFSGGIYGAYDNDTEEGTIKAIASLAFGQGSSVSLGGYWTSGATYALTGDGIVTRAIALPTGYAAPVYTNALGIYRSDIDLWGEWSLQGEFAHKFNDKLNASLGVVYINNVQFADEGGLAAYGLGGDVDFWRVGTTVNYTVTPGFNVKANVNYNKFAGDGADFSVNGDKFNDGYVSGWLRFQRNF